MSRKTTKEARHHVHKRLKNPLLQSLFIVNIEKKLLTCSQCIKKLLIKMIYRYCLAATSLKCP